MHLLDLVNNDPTLAEFHGGNASGSQLPVLACPSSAAAPAVAPAAAGAAKAAGAVVGAAAASVAGWLGYQAVAG